MSLQKENEIDDFEVISLIASQKLSEVYLVKKKNGNDGKEFAVKMWRRKKPLGREEIQSLKLINSKCQHTFIQSFVKAFTFQNKYCMVSVYVGKMSLKNLITDGGVLNEKRARFYTACLLSALHFLHTSARIVHGDIGLTNLVLDNHGHAVLIDFGSSHQLSISNSNTAISLKTSSSMSIENDIKGYECDYKQMALCLFELMTKKTRFICQSKEYSDIVGPRVNAFIEGILCNKSPLLSKQLMRNDFFDEISWTRLNNRRYQSELI